MKKDLLIYNIVSVVVLALGIVIVMSATRWGWEWTGMVGYTTPHTPADQEYVPGKTLWDVLELLVVPAALALIAVWFSNREKYIEREITTDRQREAALQAYYDKMTELLEKDLRQPPAEKEARYIARSRTLATLRSLDGSRKGLLIKFLYEAKLIDRADPIVLLKDADLSQVELENAVLSGVDLYRTNLKGANLRGANLSEANLEKANLEGATLWGVDFTNAFLRSTILRGARLGRSAKFTGADLSFAVLAGANMKGHRVSWKEAPDWDSLEEGAQKGFKFKVVGYENIITMGEEQLAQAKSLIFTVMPDGHLYDPQKHPEVARLRQAAGLKVDG